MKMVTICVFMMMFATMAYGSEYEEAMINSNIFSPESHWDDASNQNLNLQSRNAEPEPTIKYSDDEMAFGELSTEGTITIEQFINALRKKKQSQAANKTKKKTNCETGKKLGGKPPKSIKSKEKERKVQIKKSVNKKSSGIAKPVSSGKSNKILKATPVHKQKSKGIQQVKKTKVVSPKKTSARRPKSKFAPAKKPVNKSKVSKKAPAEEEEDPFLSGSLNAHQHSDHHVHHHDHLESHKHNHKHKEDHSHEHAHNNDHVHNHKHTHNHEHNHIHKHNEAHEHNAEHQHTEKHHHKHLEYIDAGGWRRRQDNIEEDHSQLSLIPDDPSNFDIISLDNSNEDSISNNFDATPVGHSPFDNIPTPTITNAFDKLTSSNKYPVEVEEISFEEYLGLQDKGETFEEDMDDFEDNGVNHEIEQEFGYDIVNQIPYSINNDMLRRKFENIHSAEEIPDYEIDAYEDSEIGNDWVPEDYDIRASSEYAE